MSLNDKEKLKEYRRAQYLKNKKDINASTGIKNFNAVIVEVVEYVSTGVKNLDVAIVAVLE